MEKYKRQEVSPVEEENERNETYQASNPQIDSSRTHLNYHIILPTKSYMEIINERLSELELKRKIRSDAILMNSFIVTSDGEFFKGLHPWEQREFFRDCAEFFSRMYGEENMISAVVSIKFKGSSQIYRCACWQRLLAIKAFFFCPSEKFVISFSNCCL